MAYTKKIWKDYPDTTTPITAEGLNNIEDGIENIENNVNNIENGIEELDTRLNDEEMYVQATAGANGDFFVNLTNQTLVNGRIVKISFPTATVPSANARLSIDGGSNYYNIKLLRGFSTVPASLIESGYRVFRFDGTNFIWINTNLVAYYKVTTAGTTTGAIPVDINADGGVYDIILKGGAVGGSNPGSMLVYYNEDTTATNYYYRRIYAKADNTITTQGGNAADGGYIYKYATLNVSCLTLSGIYPALNTANTIISTLESVEALNYMQYYGVSTSNITQLRISTGNNMGVGTEIKIYKR